MLLMMKLQEFEIINLLSQKTEEIDVLRDNHSALKIQSKEGIVVGFCSCNASLHDRIIIRYNVPRPPVCYASNEMRFI